MPSHPDRVRESYESMKYDIRCIISEVLAEQSEMYVRNTFMEAYKKLRAMVSHGNIYVTLTIEENKDANIS